MYRRMLVIALLTLLTLPFTANNWCQAGTSPPSLLSIDMSPTNVDVSTTSAEITISLHLTDNLSGVASWSTTLYSPSGIESVTIEESPGLVSGTLLDGIFEGTGTLQQGSEEGAWSTNIVTVTDAAGNTTDIDLSSYGIFLIQVGASLEDLTPPNVIDIEISPMLVNVTDSDQQVSVSAHMTDDLSGVTYGYIYFYSPSGNRYTRAYLNRTAGTSLDGTFEGNATFLQYTEPGVWRPQTCTDYSVSPYREYACMHVYDRVGNYASVDLDAMGVNLEVEVLGPTIDDTPPNADDVQITANEVDVTNGDSLVSVSAHMTDDLSGVTYGYIYFYSPSGNRYTRAYLNRTAGTSLDGTFEGNATFLQYTEPGVWRPQTCTDYSVSGYREYACMHVYDRIGNYASVDLDAMGVNLEVEVTSPVEDLLSPDLQTISMSPNVLDISEGDATLTVSAHMTDDLSGVTYGYIYFYSPSGNRYTRAYLNRTAGTSLDGTFEGNATFLQYTEPGVWRPQTCTDYSVSPYREYACMHVYDRVGNYASVDLTGTGLPLTLGVLSVPVEMIFTLVPQTSESEVNSSHTLTATISQGGVPLQDSEVTFEIIEGPHQGTTETISTDAGGVANFTYTGTSPGVDTIIASVDVERDGEVDAARQATKEWIAPSNQPPEALCQDVTVPTESGLCTASASIDAGSSDPDDDPITLAQTPAGPYGFGTIDVILTVSDDKGLSDSCAATVTVLDQEPPALSCTVPLVAECTSQYGAAVSFSASVTDNCTENPSVVCDHASGSLFTLGSTSVTCTASDGSGNANSCDFTATVEDTTAPVPDVAELSEVRGECSAAIASPPTATDDCAGTVTGTTSDSFSYSEQGTYTVTWNYADNSGNTTKQTQTVMVEDTTPPELSITADPDTLWPPNHKMKPVTVTADVSDNCDSDPACKITSVSSNEPENGTGDGDTAPDWEITGDLTLNLRTERAGGGTGRIYTITVECTDNTGNSSNADANVTVPHSQ